MFMSYLNHVRIPRSVGCVRFLEFKIIQLDFKRVYTPPNKQTTEWHRATGAPSQVVHPPRDAHFFILHPFSSRLIQGSFTSSLFLFVDDTVTASVFSSSAHFFFSLSFWWIMSSCPLSYEAKWKKVQKCNLSNSMLQGDATLTPSVHRGNYNQTSRMVTFELANQLKWNEIKIWIISCIFTILSALFY